jgi:hypothetical protein
MKCEICGDTLDDNGRPLKYCEWQQGRCPKQKHKPDAVAYVAIILMYFLLFMIMWLGLN